MMTLSKNSLAKKIGNYKIKDFAFAGNSIKIIDLDEFVSLQ